MYLWSACDGKDTTISALYIYPFQKVEMGHMGDSGGLVTEGDWMLDDM